jgi:hypothetical protein
MYGSSPWQRVPDVLEMYGMCSYRNWYEYLEFVDPEKGKGRDNLDGRCDGLSRTLGCQVIFFYFYFFDLFRLKY